MWYWYELVLMGLITHAVMYVIKFHVLDGSDILLYFIKKY
jgi:hypothetical protein